MGGYCVALLFVAIHYVNRGVSELLKLQRPLACTHKHLLLAKEVDERPTWTSSLILTLAVCISDT